MSQYIHSFLIEPVARRLPRPSFGSADVPPPPPSHESTVLPTVPTAAHEAQPTHNVSQQASDVAVEALDVQAEASLADLSLPCGPSEHFGGSLRLVEVENLEPAVPARRYVLRVFGGEEAANRPEWTPDEDVTEMRTDGSNAGSQDEAESTRWDRTTGMGRDIMSGSTQEQSEALPEDDGMRHMRRRILEIQRTNSSDKAKAHMLHGLMNEKYNSSRQSLQERARSPAVHANAEPPVWSPAAHDKTPPTLSSPHSSPFDVDIANPFNLSPEDLQPTFYTRPAPAPKDVATDRKPSEDAEPGSPPKALGCAHYKRNIKLQCSTCQRWYTCRFCHDAVEGHSLNRRETKNMLCILCGCAQPASEECASCHERAAWYYCNVCKLWDDDPRKSIYHCNDCGICRIGQGLGKDFFHCKTCCVCMSVVIKDTHRCIERSTDCDCPICGEYMFTSPETVVFMRCGHSIHQRCYSEHMRTSYRCPICCRSIVNMEWQFARLERAIEAQPMPEEFQNTKAIIYCNDCSAKTTVPYHWLGLKCAICHSYNTAQVSLQAAPSETEGSDPEAETVGPQTRTNGISIPSRPSSRGRLRGHSLSRTYLQPAAAASLPLPPPGPVVNPFSASLAFPQPAVRNARSLSPSMAPSYSFTDFGGMSGLEDGEDDSEGSETSDDVDFWGGDGQSPRLWTRSPPAGHQSNPEPNSTANRHVDDAEMAVDDTSSDDEDEMDEDEEEEGEDDDDMNEFDRMELIGHR